MPATKTALITGCSDGGIGSALAHAYAERDFHVFATARDLSKMSSFADVQNVTLLQLDVTDDEHISQIVQAVSQHTHGQLDVLINNAGRNHFMPLLDESIAQAKAIFDTNVWDMLTLTKALSPLLIAAKGTIANITSVSGHLNIPWMGTYAASKRSMEIMAETLRLELKPFGVRVVSVVTGPVKTHGLDYFGNFKLPRDSIYVAIEPIIYKRAQDSGIPKERISSKDWAEKVAPLLLKDTQSGLIWDSSFTTRFVKFATAWLPVRILDSLWMKGTGLDEMLKQP